MRCQLIRLDLIYDPFITFETCIRSELAPAISPIIHCKVSSDSPVQTIGLKIGSPLTSYKNSHTAQVHLY
uniref:Ovule protein n=1 Tax=Steinernema glaseri TaxID=37863 RepID=A0A1I7Z4S3_9BILA